jgi:hypothetical protein
MTVPSYIGASGLRDNIGETKSHGVEIDLSLIKHFENGLGLYFDGNISVSENRVVFYDESDLVPFNLKAEGKPVDIFIEIVLESCYPCGSSFLLF